MVIPDQSHINRIREALWQRPEGCASVMIGAGFSRNAKKAGTDAREFPLWHEVASLLCSRLYPPGDGDRFERAMAESSGTSGFLRLAQEYEAAFGRGALHNLIQEIVPDDDYVPDDLHTRLLRLPWRDVFTTNWDTLLERTRALVAHRAYGVARTPEEIPSAPRPRIVKLHGSFPAHIPFIFTEEDFRTYPKRFAPFVNTVQQAMMETVFCLIGFSGEDPNFLHWSGWVRDNLGESTPKIYLAGWLALSPHRRRMLEERNVVPIDLARHPKANSWPEHLHHRYATEWILHTLERGRPYEVTEWPSPPDWSRSPVPDPLQPVEDVTVDAPVKEPKPPERGAELSSLPEIVRAWEHNRNVYPGWLVIPPSKHRLVGMFMHDWERAILRAVPELQPIERLSAIRELIWRRENLLEPLSERVEEAIQAILVDIDCQARKIGGVEDRSVRWAEIREAWRDLALALLTAARQRFDRDTFDSRLAALCPFIDDHSDVAQRVHHEKCLWALYDLDFAALDELLRAWHPEGCDPAWMTRKAAILVETDRNDEAVRLLNRSLSIVREQPQNDRTLANPSREGWALLLALAFERNFFQSTDEVVEAPPAFRRSQELSALSCNAFSQKRDLFWILQSDPEKEKGPVFDLGVRRGETITISNIGPERWIAARRAIRLCEVAGLPPSASGMVVASDILSMAVDRLVNTDFAMVLRLSLRLAKSEDDAILNRVCSRYRIASMPVETVDELVALVNKIINYSLPKAIGAGDHSGFWVTRLRVAIEVLSRLILRLPPEQTVEVLRKWLNFYRMAGVAKHPWLHSPINHMLKRSWETLPKELRSSLILEVLSTPIVGLDGFEASGGSYPDPGDLLVNDVDTPAPDRNSETERRWSEIVQLIIRGLHNAGEARWRAASRLVPLALWGRLTESETDTVAQILWNTEFNGVNILPSGTRLLDWIFLMLPEPEPGLAEKLFRKRRFESQEPKSEKGLNEFFWKVGNAFVMFRNHSRPLVLTKQEQANLIKSIERWIELPLSSDDNPFVDHGTRRGIIGLQSILLEIYLSSAVVDKMYAKASSMNQTKFPGFRLFAGILRSSSGRLDEIATSLRIGLASENLVVAEEAVSSLHVWLRAASEEEFKVQLPPDDLIREVGIMIASRRKGVLFRALQVALWIFSSGSPEQRKIVVEMTLNGLRYLLEELRYDRDYQDDSEMDIPLHRWGCAHLALAMSESGYRDDPAVRRWAEVAQNDPLPEVRFAKSPASVHKHEKGSEGD